MMCLRDEGGKYEETSFQEEADHEQAWTESEAYEAGIIEGEVLQVVKGGLIIL